MKLLIGLGNIGKEYENTRHNVGFECIELLQQHLSGTDFKPQEKFFAAISEGQLAGEKVLLAKPTTFMNLSGKAVVALASFYKVDVSDILVMYDDLDLPLGTLRIRPDGGPGTHNGMRSIVQSLGSESFPRLRIGVESRGDYAPQQMDTSSFVLGKWKAEEREIVQDVLSRAVDAAVMIFEKGLQEAMNVYNDRVKEE